MQKQLVPQKKTIPENIKKNETNKKLFFEDVFNALVRITYK